MRRIGEHRVGHTLTGNNANLNGGWGIYVAASATDGGGNLGQRPGLAGVGPGEKWPFLAVDRNDHSVLADQRVAEARREGRCGVFVSPDMAGQFQLSQQFVRVEVGHVSVGRAAQVDAERGENQRGQQCERQRQAQRDRLAPFAHDQRISIT